ncbi:MAG: hypothetical protein HY059_06195 [Proteobacteria bacterium]|nr:hypothetical protein [Pseudomonadota bacterium]
MTNLTSVSWRVVGAIVVLAVPLGAAQAQQAAGAQLAFGYQCNDFFALRNDGAAPVTAEYAVAGTSERGTVTVRPNETVQLESRTPNDLQLYVDGRLVATEPKGYRDCADVAASAVVVRHLEPRELVYVDAPDVVYVRPWHYGYYPAPIVRIGWNEEYAMYGGHRGGLSIRVRPPIVRDRDRGFGGGYRNEAYARPGRDGRDGRDGRGDPPRARDPRGGGQGTPRGGGQATPRGGGQGAGTGRGGSARPAQPRPQSGHDRSGSDGRRGDHRG